MPGTILRIPRNLWTSRNVGVSYGWSAGFTLVVLDNGTFGRLCTETASCDVTTRIGRLPDQWSAGQYPAREMWNSDGILYSDTAVCVCLQAKPSSQSEITRSTDFCNMCPVSSWSTYVNSVEMMSSISSPNFIPELLEILFCESDWFEYRLALELGVHLNLNCSRNSGSDLFWVFIIFCVLI